MLRANLHDAEMYGSEGLRKPEFSASLVDNAFPLRSHREAEQT
jgi:hypothetical protein